MDEKNDVVSVEGSGRAVAGGGLKKFNFIGVFNLTFFMSEGELRLVLRGNCGSLYGTKKFVGLCEEAEL